MIIRRVSPLSVAKVAGLLYAFVGLLIGGVVSLVMMTIGSAASEQMPHGGAFGMMFGAGAVILFPLFYGVGGAIFAAISAAIYNLVAGMIGGIEIEIDGMAPAPRTTV